jgi:pSer/pThr/pTyr-binding forkhead associated (FHA) protein
MGLRLVLRKTAGANREYIYEFDQPRVVIGRGTGVDVRIPFQTVSGHHATVRVEGTGYVLTDEGSTNGTWVNGTKLPPSRPKPLRTGDAIQIGPFVITVQASVPIADPTSVIHTAAIARRLVREVLEGAGDATNPTLRVLHGPQAGETLEISAPPARLVVGRAANADLILSDADASREHVEVVRDLDGVFVRDLGAKNPLVVNDRPVGERRLSDRDELLIGATVLVFEDPAESAIRAMERQPDEPADPPTPLLPAEPTDPEVNDPSPGDDPVISEPLAASAPLSVGETPRTKRARRRPPSADVVIYLLAAIVLALSIAGLVVLLRAG